MFVWFAAYLVAGIAVFFALRVTFQKTRLDPRVHDKIWMHCLYSLEGWILGPLLWPVLAIVSLLWFAADLLHAQGKKEIAKAADIEAMRDKRYDHLDLMQKIDRLKAESEKQK